MSLPLVLKHSSKAADVVVHYMFMFMDKVLYVWAGVTPHMDSWVMALPPRTVRSCYVVFQPLVVCCFVIVNLYSLIHSYTHTHIHSCTLHTHTHTNYTKTKTGDAFTECYVGPE
eukprot:m.220888 g.220888  ORF g.220888 m.220888 type:complete len:114 (-) comp13836_c1_seq5:1656-1997(-)